MNTEIIGEQSEFESYEQEMKQSRLYIAVHTDVPDYMVPTLVAHTMLNAHINHSAYVDYELWREYSFKKCVVRVNDKEFKKIADIPGVYLGHENTTMGGEKSCAIPIPVPNSKIPNVLKFSKLWSPKNDRG